MIQRYWLTYSLALSAALLSGQCESLNAQSLNYSISVSPLPARVGQPLTITVPVPTTVPDGTSFTATAQNPYHASCNSDPCSPYDSFTVSGTSLNHVFTAQIPAPTEPETFSIAVGQDSNPNFFISYDPPNVYHVPPSIALGFAQVNLIVSAAGQSPSPTAVLQGNYSFMFQGQTTGAPGSATGVAMVGNITADGNGNITDGSVYLNSAIGITLPGSGVEGTYQLDATGKGTITLNTYEKFPLSFNFFVPSAGPGVIVNNGSIVPIGGLTGSGEFSKVGDFFQKQTLDPAFYPSFSASAEFSAEVTPGAGFTPGAGLIAFNSTGLITAVTSVTSQLTSGNPDGFTGTTYRCLGCADSGASHISLTLATPGQPSTTPTEYIGYLGSKPSGGVLYFMSVDPHTVTNLIVGKAEY